MRSSLRHLRRFFSPSAAAAFFPRLLRRFVFASARLALLFRNRTLQRNLQLLDRRMREDHSVMPQQVIWMHFIPAHQLEPVDIARAQLQIAVVVLGGLYNENRLLYFQRVKRLLEFLSLRFLK